MKSTGIVRQVDLLGRIVIPKELRRHLNIEREDSLEIFMKEECIVLKKYEPGCIFCDEVSDVVPFEGKVICRECIGKLQNSVTNTYAKDAE